MLNTASVNFVYISRQSRRRESEQNLFVGIGKSEAKVSNNKILIMHSGYCTVEANYRQTQSRGLSATAELL